MAFSIELFLLQQNFTKSHLWRRNKTMHWVPRWLERIERGAHLWWKWFIRTSFRHPCEWECLSNSCWWMCTRTGCTFAGSLYRVSHVPHHESKWFPRVRQYFAGNEQMIRYPGNDKENKLNWIYTRLSINSYQTNAYLRCNQFVCIRVQEHLWNVIIQVLEIIVCIYIRYPLWCKYRLQSQKEILQRDTKPMFYSSKLNSKSVEFNLSYVLLPTIWHQLPMS